MSDGAVDSTGFRMLHTMIRVKDLDKSKDFYTRFLGMKVMRESENETGKYTVCFIGYGDETKDHVVELTYNWGREEGYDLGTGFGHLAIAVPDAYATCAALEAEGLNIPRPAGPVIGGTRVIAFIEDPDGYKIELVQRD